MLKGLFLDPRSWKIDFRSSSFWNTERFGLKIDLHPDAFNIPKLGVSKEYTFVLCSEVWEIPLRKTLKYLRNKGLKIFLVAREPFKTSILKDAMFSHNKFLYDGEYYFKPDVVFAAGKSYADLWSDKTKTIITGYPRFDYYVDKSKWPTKNDICNKYGLDEEKKMIFFPSYPPYHYKKENNKDVLIDLFAEQEETIEALAEFAKSNDSQVIVKIHPVAWKSYKKGVKTKDVSGLMKKYLDVPTSFIKVIGDERFSGLHAKELLVVSDIVVGFTSTMLLEAAMINKPSVHVLFGKTANLDGIPEYCKYLPTAYNKNELISILTNNITGVAPNSFVEQYFYKIDGKACERICNAIKEEMK